MMNKVTKAERETIIARAEFLCIMRRGELLNARGIERLLQREFSISKDRARRAVATAARRLRRPTKRGTA